MDGTALTDEAARGAEADLARAAAAGDPGALAALYERHGGLAFNLAYRITGSKAKAATAVREGFLAVMRRLAQLPDREMPFTSHLLIATRHACFELMEGRPGKSSPGPAIAAAVDPDAIANPEDEVRVASLRLPERQREVLALRELGRLSYEEIAVIVEANRNSVAQLISRARINLSDELHGTVLASIAAPSPECERALPLIASREDGQLDAASEDAAWLEAHLPSCERCRLGVEAMQEASASYGKWVPLAAPAGLLEETMARATELTGGDSTQQTTAVEAVGTPVAPPPSAANQAEDGDRDRPRRRVLIAAALALLLLLILSVVAVLGDDDPAPTSVEPAAGKQGERRKAGKQRERSTKAGDARKNATRNAAASPAAIDAQPLVAAEGGSSAEPTPIQSPSNSPSATGTVRSTQQASKPSAKAKPKPSPAPAPAPAPVAAPAPAPAPEEADQTPGKGRGKGEPPAHSPGHPSAK